MGRLIEPRRKMKSTTRQGRTFTCGCGMDDDTLCERHAKTVETEEQSEAVNEPVALYWRREVAERTTFGDAPTERTSDFLRGQYVIKPVEVSLAPVREVAP